MDSVDDILVNTIRRASRSTPEGPEYARETDRETIQGHDGEDANGIQIPAERLRSLQSAVE